MAPQHDSDLPENRWKESEWKTFVLWEKIEHRLKNRKRWVIAFVTLISLSILALPIIKDRHLKWFGVSVLRKASFEIQKLEIESAKIQKPIVIQLFKDGESIFLKGESVQSCLDYSGRALLHSVEIIKDEKVKELTVLTESIALELGLTTLSQQFCYDPEKGQIFKSPLQLKTTLGFIPVNDLSEKRLDRMSFLEVKGAEAILQFD